MNSILRKTMAGALALGLVTSGFVVMAQPAAAASPDPSASLSDSPSLSPSPSVTPSASPSPTYAPLTVSIVDQGPSGSSETYLAVVTGGQTPYTYWWTLGNSAVAIGRDNPFTLDLTCLSGPQGSSPGLLNVEVNDSETPSLVATASIAIPPCTGPTPPPPPATFTVSIIDQGRSGSGEIYQAVARNITSGEVIIPTGYTWSYGELGWPNSDNPFTFDLTCAARQGFTPSTPLVVAVTYGMTATEDQSVGAPLGLMRSDSAQGGLMRVAAATAETETGSIIPPPCLDPAPSPSASPSPSPSPSHRVPAPSAMPHTSTGPASSGGGSSLPIVLLGLSLLFLGVAITVDRRRGFYR